MKMRINRWRPGLGGKERAPARSRARAAVFSGLLLLALSACSTVTSTTDTPNITEPTPNPVALSAAAGATATGTVSFQNTGDAALTYTATTEQAWLQVSPSSGTVSAGGSHNLTLTASCPTAASYSGQVTIGSNDPDRPTSTVTVNLSCGSTSGVIWQVEPTSLDFSAALGETPGTQSFTLTNAGTANGTYTISDDADWLSADPSTSSIAGGGYHTVTLSVTGCTVEGSETATVTVSGDGSTATLNVTRTCTDSNMPLPVMTDPSPDPLPLAAEVNASDSGEISFANSGTTDLIFTVTDDQPWLNVTPASGTVAPESGQTLTATATCPASADTLSGTVTVASNDPVAPSKSVTVELVCDSPPPPPELLCNDPAAGQTLTCESAEAGVKLVVPGQTDSRHLTARSLPLDGLGDPAPAGGFTPTRSDPLLHVGVFDADTDEPVTAFDPPMELTVAYEGEDFDAASPTFEVGELGLGVWDGEAWVVVGHGVFEAGFWVADPLVSATNFELAVDVADSQPRFMMRGGPGSGDSVAHISETFGSLVISWGRTPPASGREFVRFSPDGCQDLTEFLECTSEDGRLTIRIPPQGSRTVRAIALPMNLRETLTPPSPNGEEIELIEQPLMNFLVVDADSNEVLTELNPPFEFVATYRDAEVDAALDESGAGSLALVYWHEGVETYRVLGEGNPNTNCDTESTGCEWGGPNEADDLVWIEDPEGDDPAGEWGGIAAGSFSAWGDRHIAFGGR